MRALNVFLSIVVSALIAFAVFEGGLRLFPAFRPTESINEFHPTLGWAKQKNAKVRRKTPEFSITIATNADGLRDDPIGPKREDTYRILCLGDSFVLGYTVDRKDLFVDLLEDQWRAGGAKVELVNAGTEGYSTDQEVLWYAEEGRKYDADLVLLFPYQNDIYWDGQERYTRYPKPRYAANGKLESGTLKDPGSTPLIQRLAVMRMLGVLATQLGLGGPRPDQVFTPAGTEAEVFREFAPLFVDPPDFLADCEARTRGALQALKQACEADGARLLVVPIPAETGIHEEERRTFQEESLAGVPEDAWSPDRPVDFFLRQARELGLETLDARPALAAAASGGERLYFEQEWHFNPAGNRAFKGFLKAELEGLGLVPAGTGAADAAALGRTTEAGFPTWAIVFLVLWGLLGTSYASTYPDEPKPLAYLKVGLLLGFVFSVILGGSSLMRLLPHAWTPFVVLGFVAVVLGFVAYKLGRRLGTIGELLAAFTLRGHWYLMPLVVVLLSVGSLLVVAASSPFIAPFIYTLF